MQAVTASGHDHTDLSGGRSATVFEMTDTCECFWKIDIVPDSEDR